MGVAGGGCIRRGPGGRRSDPVTRAAYQHQTRRSRGALPAADTLAGEFTRWGLSVLGVFGLVSVYVLARAYGVIS